MLATDYMEPLQNLFNVVACIAGIVFFASFVLTFWPSKINYALAAILYGIGIMACMSPYAYFHFFRGSNWTFGRFPTLEWLMPILFLCFGIVAIVFLWPSIPQKIAMRLGMALFFVICPTLVITRMTPEFLQFHHHVALDLTWLVYAVIWFRVRDSYVKMEKNNVGNITQTP